MRFGLATTNFVSSKPQKNILKEKAGHICNFQKVIYEENAKSIHVDHTLFHFKNLLNQFMFLQKYILFHPSLLRTLGFSVISTYLKAMYYTVEVYNFDLQEKTTRNNNNTITAK